MSLSAGTDWSRHEVDLTVADYFAMLHHELMGQAYNKTEHRQRLRQLIPHRSDGSIEFKHQNISAVLVNMGLPYIDGYKPRGNFQRLLLEAVQQHLESQPAYFEHLASGPVLSTVPAAPSMPPEGWRDALSDPPDRIELPTDREPWRDRRPAQIDFVARDAKNRRLGQAGEQWVVALERQRLASEGRDDLADRVQWVSDQLGDGMGFDVLSFSTRDESEKWIEVKTTSLGRYFPFYVSRNEVRCSQAEPHRYHLYRVYDFVKQPRAYVLQGALTQTCRLDPVQYRAAI